MTDVADRDLQKEADQRRHTHGKSAEADMKRAEARREKSQRGDPQLAVKRLVEEKDRCNARNHAEEEVLQKNQHRRGAALFRLGQNAQNRQSPPPQPNRRYAPREKPRQAQAVIHRAEQDPREERPQIKLCDCCLREIHGQ
ncbi:MAG TPA: hypothetical protein DDW30_05130 [Clostridiales bacterium]|nr:hypothetical protein [Clostridiales bacterium]